MTDERERKKPICVLVKNFLKAFYLYPVFKKDIFCIYFNCILHVLVYVMSIVYRCFYGKS